MEENGTGKCWVVSTQIWTKPDEIGFPVQKEKPSLQARTKAGSDPTKFDLRNSPKRQLCNLICLEMHTTPKQTSQFDAGTPHASQSHAPLGKNLWTSDTRHHRVGIRCRSSTGSSQPILIISPLKSQLPSPNQSSAGFDAASRLPRNQHTPESNKQTTYRPAAE